MTLKAALCPSCGGKMQLADNLGTTKCTYCGVDVIVHDAIRLAGRVKEFTLATPIQKVDKLTPFDIESAQAQTQAVIIIFAAIGLVVSIWIGISNLVAGIIVAVGVLVVASIIRFVRNSNLDKIRKADIEMLKRSPNVDLIAYSGQCPYCDTSITLSANVLGGNCPACQKRVVLRDSKFFSVDTPVGVLIEHS